MHKEFRGSGGAFEFIRPFLVMMGMGAMSKMIAGQELIRENLFDYQRKWDGTPRQRNALQILILMKIVVPSIQWKNDSKEIIFELKRCPRNNFCALHTIENPRNNCCALHTIEK